MARVTGCTLCPASPRGLNVLEQTGARDLSVSVCVSFCGFVCVSVCVCL